ncbi:MAG: Lrp/AsnC family transcriptional regulator [Deltaproteobacteria bacterium]|nr:MAG: Lrp/AsnC family transcriptional regulator [Deltaproteobacteria bacterium]
MKFGRASFEYDATDRAILELLQENCKQPLAAIGEKVGLSAPAVVERIHKLEEAGVVLRYTAVLDPRKLGRDITAFIGVSTDRPGAIDRVEAQVGAMDEVLECHHVTGGYTLMLKVKTRNTESLERLIDSVRSLDGVSRTETMVVLSTHTERSHIALDADGDPPERPRRGKRRSSEPDDDGG